MPRRGLPAIAGTILFALLLASPSFAGPRCISQAQFDAKVKKLAADDEAHYRAALKKQKLVPITLPLQTWGVERIGRPPEPRETTKDGKHLLLAGTAGVMCGASGGGSPFFLARGGDKIYVIEKRSQTHDVNVGVCAPKTCTPPVDPGGCGTAPAPTMFAYELPPNTSFGGDRSVDIVSYWATAEIVGKNPCPEMPPEAPRP